MTAHFNIDEVLKHIKIIADKNRCGVCDKLPGDRLRYLCGHAICGECVVVADECLICTSSSQTQPAVDLVQGQLVQNVSNLLTTFQETFNIDVYKRYRLSEKLKIENELFPECIQASVKYYNKRKSSIIRTSNDKENLEPFFAGEELNKSYSTKMNTRINLVQKWLEKNEEVGRPVRKPFSDININNSIRSNKENKINKSHNLNNLNKKSKKTISKQTNVSKNAKHKKSRNVSSPSVISFYKNKTINKESNIENKFNFAKKCDKSLRTASECNHDSDIDVDRLDTIVIEDTQTQVVDKDKDAWLKVVEEHNRGSNDNFNDNQNENFEQKPLSKYEDKLKPASITTEKNVNYYKKAYLFKSCHLCLRNVESVSSENQRLNMNNVSITINTNNISSTITVLREDDDFIDKIITKHSIETQTDSGIIASVEPKHLSQSYENISSPDLFVDDVKKHAEFNENFNSKDIGISDNSKSRCVVSDSDSDGDIDCSGPIKVSVDVHRSNDMEGILSTMDSGDYQSRVRRSTRRPTVDSNNSSEKENLEPNRIKRRRLGKKHGLKK